LNVTASTNDEDIQYRKANSNKEIQLDHLFAPNNIYGNLIYQSNQNVRGIMPSPITNTLHKINLDQVNDNNIR
jgi:hypothetical protein